MANRYEIVAHSFGEISIRENYQSLIKTKDNSILQTSTLVAELNQKERFHKDKMEILNAKLALVEKIHNENLEVKREHNAAIVSLTTKIDEIKHVLLLMPTMTLTGPDTQTSMSSFNNVRDITQHPDSLDS